MAKELDVVRLLNGQQGTVLETYDGGKRFLVEIVDDHGKTIEMLLIAEGDIADVEYSA